MQILSLQLQNLILRNLNSVVVSAVVVFVVVWVRPRVEELICDGVFGVSEFVFTEIPDEALTDQVIELALLARELMHKLQQRTEPLIVKEIHSLATRYLLAQKLD